MTWFFTPLIAAGVFVLGLVLFVLLSASCEVGYRVGRWRGTKLKLTKEEVDTTNTLTAGMLALLAFILGFTIDFAQQRFEARRELVVEEANAIGTAWRRAEMIGGSDAEAIAADIASYAQVRLAFTRADIDGPLEALSLRTEALQNDIWIRATRIARAQPNPITATLATALNTMFDDAQSQRFAFDAQVPTDMLTMLLCGSMLSIGAMGFQMGVAGARQPILSSLLLIMWTGGMVVTVDLNRSRVGHIRVDTTPFHWVLNEIRAAPTAAPVAAARAPAPAQ